MGVQITIGVLILTSNIFTLYYALRNWNGPGEAGPLARYLAMRSLAFAALAIVATIQTDQVFIVSLAVVSVFLQIADIPTHLRRKEKILAWATAIYVIAMVVLIVVLVTAP